MIDNSDTRVQTTLDPGLKRMGHSCRRAYTRSARRVGRWGARPIDREYSNYDAFKEYLPALGIKRIRLQGGWARTEKDPGVYDFAWLDHIINDARSRRLEIWLETSYGNPAYPGGGGRTLAGGFPTSDVGWQAWDTWVEMMATRYKDKVRDWSVWNEPELRDANKPELIIEFNIRTAEIIKRIIPEARIAATVGLLSRERNRRATSSRPSPNATRRTCSPGWSITITSGTRMTNTKPSTPRREIVHTYTPTLRLWQGEAGTQSEWCGAGAGQVSMDRADPGEVEHSPHVGRYRPRLRLIRVHGGRPRLPYDGLPQRTRALRPDQDGRQATAFEC